MKEYMILLDIDIKRAKEDYEKAVVDLKEMLKYSEIERQYHSNRFTQVAIKIDDAKARYDALVKTKQNIENEGN